MKPWSIRFSRTALTRLGGHGRSLSPQSVVACPLRRNAPVVLVVILRRSSNFAGATVSGVYADRDCAQYFYIAVDTLTGSAQFERRNRQQAVEAIPRRFQSA